MISIATLRERILELLLYDGAKKVSEIADAMGVNTSYARSAIAQLQAEGLAEGSVDGTKIQAVRHG